MKLEKKTTATLLIAIFMISAIIYIAPAMAKKEQLTISTYQSQWQWRALPSDGKPSGGPIGDWSRSYVLSYDWDWEFELTGKVLHTYMGYLPWVEDEVGGSFIFVYNQKVDRWIVHEGTIGYTSPYSGFTITEYWKGYLEFVGSEESEGSPTDYESFHGVGYQFCYVYGLDESTVKAEYPHAVWDETMDAWYLGFSIYLWDSTDVSYALEYIDFPFLEPVPKSDYDPLEL